MTRAPSIMTRTGLLLRNSHMARAAELAVVFVPAVAIIAVAGRFAGGNPIAVGTVTSAANLWMLLDTLLLLRMYFGVNAS